MDKGEARLCPRCGVAMEYRVESESLSNGTRRITYYYRCPRCGYKMYDAVIIFDRVDGEIRVKVAEYKWAERPASTARVARRRARRA